MADDKKKYVALISELSNSFKKNSFVHSSAKRRKKSFEQRIEELREIIMLIDYEVSQNIENQNKLARSSGDLYKSAIQHQNSEDLYNHFVAKNTDSDQNLIDAKKCCENEISYMQQKIAELNAQINALERNMQDIYSRIKHYQNLIEQL